MNVRFAFFAFCCYDFWLAIHITQIDQTHVHYATENGSVLAWGEGGFLLGGEGA